MGVGRDPGYGRLHHGWGSMVSTRWPGGSDWGLWLALSR